MATRSSVSALILATAGAIGTSCGGEEFCAEGSYECSGTGAAAGTGAVGGTTGSGGTSAAGNGGGAMGGTSATGGGGGIDGGAAGTGGSAGSGATGGTTGAAGMGGAGEGGSTSVPATCDPTAPEAGCVLAPGDGIFVTTTGDDSDAGTQAHPVKTIAKALVLATANGKPVYVCTATYKERLVVKADDLTVNGGYSCAGGTWTYDGTRAQVAPSTVGEALKIDGGDGFRATDLEFVAKDATAKGASSVAVFVKDADAVRFTRVRVVAGKGADGEDGVDGETVGSNHTTDNRNGIGAMGTDEGDFKDCTCGDATTSRGAAGGNGGSASNGGNGQPDLGKGGGVGGVVGDCGGLPSGTGSNGSSADDEEEADGATTLGSIAATGWEPSAGSDGANGGPGQGGGGGAGADDGGGGGGACGGCGGTGAKAGHGGGGSIAILVKGSVVTLKASTIQTDDAGAGGDGAVGEHGQNGGAGGLKSGSACNGGNGGIGGDGAASGGGAGGVSVGVLSDDDSQIDPNDTTFTLGTKGAAGQGGGADNDGIPGIAEKEKTI